MSALVLKGKQIFYNAADTRMSRDGYLSCASCHVDGEQDGQVWDFTDRGEGLRNTTSLLGQGGKAGAPLHWSGNFDEVQDFENDIRSFFGGTGLMTDADFNTGTRSQTLGDPKAGVSADLDALAAYVDSLAEPGRSPHRQPGGALTSAAVAGQALFGSLGCQSCHSGTRLSDSNTGVRHDVGTLKPSSGKRMGAPLDGIDTPTLRGLWNTAPYLHDGSAATLRDVLTTANPAGRHGDLSSLTPAQIDQVVEYLKQVEAVP
jgi:cytochrome c peroxidase